MNDDIDTTGEAIWVALVTVAAVSGSLIFACAAPFAALATIAATRMRFGAGLAAVSIAWLANQAIGYGLHGYPRDANSYGWGLAIGVAALAGTAAARAVSRRAARDLARVALAFVTAFACYEAVLLAATVPLASGHDAFTVRIVLHVAEINAVALLGLLALHRMVVAIGLPLPALPART